VRRLPEALAVAIGGGALAGTTGWLIGLAIPAAIVGLIHGFLAGYRRIYQWREWRGWVGFALDHSWGLITAFGSLISHLVAAVSKTARPVPELSERQGRHVYLGGLQLRPGFVLTVGNAISGARHLERESKQRLIRIHEMSHVWQTRVFGPIFPLVYLVWGIVVGLVSFVVGLITKRKPLGSFVEGWTYYSNPFEWWAYSREGRWPPKAGRAVVWRHPAVRARVLRPVEPPPAAPAAAVEI
jgi:hypothetical protein